MSQDVTDPYRKTELTGVSKGSGPTPAKTTGLVALTLLSSGLLGLVTLFLQGLEFRWEYLAWISLLFLALFTIPWVILARVRAIRIGAWVALLSCPVLLVFFPFQGVKRFEKAWNERKLLQSAESNASQTVFELGRSRGPFGWTRLYSGDLVPSFLAWRVPALPQPNSDGFACIGSDLISGRIPSWYFAQFSQAIISADSDAATLAYPIAQSEKVRLKSLVLNARDSKQADCSWLADLVDFKELRELSLDGVSLSRDAWASVFVGNQLEYLSLTNTNITDADAANLLQQPKLQRFVIRKPPGPSPLLSLVLDRCKNVESFLIPASFLTSEAEYMVEGGLSKIREIELEGDDKPFELLPKVEIQLAGDRGLTLIHFRIDELKERRYLSFLETAKRLRLLHCQLSAQTMIAISEHRPDLLEFDFCSIKESEFRFLFEKWQLDRKLAEMTDPKLRSLEISKCLQEKLDSIRGGNAKTSVNIDIRPDP